jgi:hypothetical protein
VRHFVGFLIGLVATLVGLVVIAYGLGFAQRAFEVLTRGTAVLGAALLLVGGAVVGAVVAARRLSLAAPLTGAVVALLIAAGEVVAPGLVYDLGAGQAFADGLGTLLGLQVPAILAGLLLVAPLGGARRAAREAPPLPPAPQWGGQPGPPPWGAPAPPPWGGVRPPRS